MEVAEEKHQKIFYPSPFSTNLYTVLKVVIDVSLRIFLHVELNVTLHNLWLRPV